MHKQILLGPKATFPDLTGTNERAVRTDIDLARRRVKYKNKSFPFALPLALIFILAGLGKTQFVYAANTEDIENLFNKDEQVQGEVNSTTGQGSGAAPNINGSGSSLNNNSTPADPANASSTTNGNGISVEGTAAKRNEGKGIANLGRLENFEDIAVIQKRYLPRTGRFEVFVGPTAVLNDAFFLNFGVNGRLAYYFSERYAIEGVGTYLSINERQVTTDLRDKKGVITNSFVTPQTYAGLDFKWSPVYGKMSWMNRKITPFDLYFSVGGGLTGTNQNTSQATLHLGTGQAFAYTKGIAWRWDFSWAMFNATSNIQSTTSQPAPSLYHNLMLTFGMSFFFPEASYR